VHVRAVQRCYAPPALHDSDRRTRTDLSASSVASAARREGRGGCREGGSASNVCCAQQSGADCERYSERCTGSIMLIPHVQHGFSSACLSTRGAFQRRQQRTFCTLETHSSAWILVALLHVILFTHTHLQAQCPTLQDGLDVTCKVRQQ